MEVIVNISHTTNHLLVYTFINLKSEFKVVIRRFDQAPFFTEEVFQKTLEVANSILVYMKRENQIDDCNAASFGKLIIQCVL